MPSVMIFGTFDIIHAGHLNLFKQAKKLGDNLTTVVARDKRVKSIKTNKPVHTEKERVEMLEHIKLIDKVILGDEDDVYKVIKNEKPDIIALGYDQQKYTDKLKEKITEFGLTTKIIRLKPYKETQYKSGIIKQNLLKQN